MRNFGQRGVAAMTVVVVIAVSAGAGAGAPVAVDVADVDPDHPLYALERMGERIRMVGDEDQLHERCSEGYLMYGKYGEEALRYDVFKEFVGKAEKLLADPATEEGVRAWLESEMDRVGIVTDVFDVDPDHPLYEFEIEGEYARGVENKELIKERLGEFMVMCKKGHGKDYAAVMEAFREKYKELVVDEPVDSPEREELLDWMEDQKEKLAEAQIELTEELLEEFPKEKIPPEIAELIGEKKERSKVLAEQIRAAATDEEREAAIRELKKAIEPIERFKEKAPQVLGEVENCLHACEVSFAVSGEIKIEFEIGADINVEQKFDADLASLEALYGQYQAEMPEEMRELIENLKAEAVAAGKTKAGLICLAKLEDELEAWERVGKASHEEYQKKYGQYKENIEKLLGIPECPKAIKLKIELLREAVEEGDYEEAGEVLEDLIAETMEWEPTAWVPFEIPSEWYPQPTIKPGTIVPKFSTLCPKLVKFGESLEIEGKTEANVTVKVYINGELKAETKADLEGNFSVSVKVEAEGTNKIEVSTVDLAGNESVKVVYGVTIAVKAVMG